MAYELIPISLIFTILYLITYLLYTENVITKALHVKIWNIIILIIGLILVIAGLITTALTEYSINVPIAPNLLFWHVEVGIALIPVAISHIHLHRERFRKITLRI